MRTKIRTTAQLKPGMVIRSSNTHAFRQVAKVEKLTPYAERVVTFTDGARERWGNGWEFQVARSKAIRGAAKARAALIPAHALSDALGAVVGAYARETVTAQ